MVLIRLRPHLVVVRYNFTKNALVIPLTKSTEMVKGFGPYRRIEKFDLCVRIGCVAGMPIAMDSSVLQGRLGVT